MSDLDACRSNGSPLQLPIGVPSLPWRRLKPFGVVLEANAKALPCSKGDLLPSLRPTVLRERVILLRGFADRLDLEEVAAAVGRPRLDAAGNVFVFDVHQRPGGSEDSVLSSERVSLHWDGFWYGTQPEFQLYKCLEAPRPGYGGESIFSDTCGAYRRAPARVAEKWAQQVFLYRPPTIDRSPDHYERWLGGATVAHQLVDRHPHTGEFTLRLRENDRDIGCVEMDKFGLAHWRNSPDLAPLYFDLLERLYSPKHLLTHAWQDGDIVLTDNRALLHGRKPYSGRRRLHRLLCEI